jgi:hypothetical protein
MSTLFDFLPLDVINYVIKPFIDNDYFARIAINALLPPNDRRGSPLRQDASKQLHLSLNLAPLKKIMHTATWAEGPLGKANGIVALFDFLINNPLILQHNLNFRNTALRQAKTFADSDCPQYTVLEDTAKTALVCKAALLLERMEKSPYLYPVNTFQGNEKWSAVDGAGVCHVADNVRLLAVAAAKERAAAAEAEKLRRSKPHMRVVYRTRLTYRSYRYDDDDYDEDEDWEYGYYDEANNWVCLEEQDQEGQEQEQAQQQSPPRISRQGTVLEADGWERVVSRKRR